MQALSFVGSFTAVFTGTFSFETILGGGSKTEDLPPLSSASVLLPSAQNGSKAVGVNFPQILRCFIFPPTLRGVIFPPILRCSVFTPILTGASNFTSNSKGYNFPSDSEVPCFPYNSKRCHFSSDSEVLCFPSNSERVLFSSPILLHFPIIFRGWWWWCFPSNSEELCFPSNSDGLCFPFQF